ncbi:MAG: molybdate ABC transporter substrate-binding protein [Alphaproteobacteria bacterium]|nr:molybdate ABC transporter substrate-binding protein [Alphaproteobacteria bacterium]
MKTIGILFALLCAAWCTAPALAADVVVFAAASMSNALGEIGADYHADTGKTVAFSFAGSSALARQIAASKGADIFISADVDWMNYLGELGYIVPDTRINLLGNTLVLIAPATSKVTLKLDRNTDLAAALGEGRLALADPNAVPAGLYAKAALQSLGLWNSVAPRIVPAENVRMALAYVARGEAPLGVVYATDARIEPRVRVVATFPRGSYPAIVYPAALIREARPGAARFLAYLKGARARDVFAKDGFTVLGK